MKKEEAILKMKLGEKITHNYFSPNEWMTMEEGKIVLEDGVRCSPSMFWFDRTGLGWENGYSIYKK